ncbi:hypothetical protein GCM10028807_45940 [Spirosoma daeguense]
MSDNTSWVANFNLGWTSYNAVFDFPSTDITIVIAGGSGYVMNRNQTQPLATFGSSIKIAILTDQDEVIATNDTNLVVVNSKGQIWTSERISWDGIADLRLEGHTIFGLAYDPTNENDDWVDFSLDLTTKQLIGGSYHRVYTNALIQQRNGS